MGGAFWLPRFPAPQLHRGARLAHWDTSRDRRRMTHRITATNGVRHLRLERSNNTVTWMRENGSNGVLELTDHGRLRSPEGEEEMDMAAEAWARELMNGDPGNGESPR